MMKTFTAITDLIGQTPLLELKNYEKAENLSATILAKLEYFNPAGSVKAVSYTHLKMPIAMKRGNKTGGFNLFLELL